MSAPEKITAEKKICGCGRELRYFHGDDMSCNKYAVCPTYDELFEQEKSARMEAHKYKTALEKVVRVNAMDYEYRAWAKNAIEPANG